MKTYLFIALLVLISGCTHYSSLDYSVAIDDGTNFSKEHLEQIDEILINEQGKEKAGEFRYYLSKTNGHSPTDVMVIEFAGQNLKVTVGRLSGAKGFSREWVNSFKNGTKEIIEKAIGKTVVINEVVKDRSATYWEKLGLKEATFKFTERGIKSESSIGESAFKWDSVKKY